MRLEPCSDCLCCDLLFLGIPFRQVEQSGNGAIRSGECFLILGSCPQDGLVLLMVAIGVFDGHVSFAYAS